MNKQEPFVTRPQGGPLPVMSCLHRLSPGPRDIRPSQQPNSRHALGYDDRAVPLPTLIIYRDPAEGGGGRFCHSRIFSIAEERWQIVTRKLSVPYRIPYRIDAFCQNFGEKLWRTFKENCVLVKSCRAILGTKSEGLRRILECIVWE